MSNSKLTMREAFKKHYTSDELSKSSKHTMEQAVRRWERLTDNPPLETTTNATIAVFRQAMISSGLAAATCNTTWTSLRSILRRVGPVTEGNPWALDLIPGWRVPAMRPVPEPFKRPRRLSMDELSRLYLAARKMDVLCRNVPNPAYWWQGLIVTAYFTGLRVADLLKARWSDLNEQEGTLFVKLNKTGVEADLPLPEVALGHIARLERRSDEIFHIGDRRFYYYIKELKGQAKLDDFSGFHDIRRTAGSEADRVRPGMGKVLLLHAPSGVTEKSYLNALPELRGVVDQMDVPAAFRHGPKMTLRMLNESQKVVTIRPRDFTVPVHPPAELFQFYEAGFMFNGTFFRALGIRTQILKILVESGGICSQRELWEKTMNGVPYPIDCIKRKPMQARIQRLRLYLNKVLSLPAGFNPIVATFFDKTEQTCRYELLLPSALWATSDQKGGST